MRKLLIATLLITTAALAVDPIVLRPAGPLSAVASKAVWTSGTMTGQQAALLFGGVPLPQMLDICGCPTNNHHIITVNVNLTNKLFAAIDPANTNIIGFVAAQWWPDTETTFTTQVPKK